MTQPDLNKAATGATQPIGIVACADDFGLNHHVDAAIIDLVKHQRLSAVGVLVQGLALRSITEPTDTAQTLTLLDTDIGLHLNFTQTWPDQPTPDWIQPWGQLVKNSYLGRLKPPVIEQAIQYQLDLFEQQFQRAPDFVDGHIHVHQLPGIREPLIACLTKRYGNRLPWVRDTRPTALSGTDMPLWQRFKAAVIGQLGGASFAKAAHAAGMRTNHGFVGVYDFSKPHLPYLQMLSIWMAHSQPNSLLMTHPSQATLEHDPMGQARLEEYHVLASAQWPALLVHTQRRLIRLSQMHTA